MRRVGLAVVLAAGLLLEPLIVEAQAGGKVWRAALSSPAKS